MSSYRAVISRAAVAATTICLAGVVARRATQEFLPAKPVQLKTTINSEWRSYATSGHLLGPSSAPVTIVEFADFQCPFCLIAAADLRLIRKKHRQEVNVLIRHYPLNMHEFAMDAAIAAECAAGSGRFEAYHDMLFAQADSIGLRSWAAFAMDVGLTDTITFKKCLKDPIVTARVRNDSDAGDRLGITGTPTFLIGEIQISGYPGSEVLERLVDAALKKRRDRKGL